MSDKPTHWEWMEAAREIRDSRTEAPEPGSLSAQLAAELGAAKGDDPINDRAEEAQQWCERIMLSEKRERLLQQYNSTGEPWLYYRLRGVIDDCLSWNPSDRPLICHNTPIGHSREGEHGLYTADFGLGIDLSGPVFNMGGIVYGVAAGAPTLVAVFSSTFTPVDHHQVLKAGAPHRGWYRDPDGNLRKGNTVRLDTTCDWHLAKNCENRLKYVLAFPLGNWIIFYATCNPCAGELSNKI